MRLSNILLVVPKRSRWLVCCGVATIWILVACTANAADTTDMAECGSLTNAYGPFDYTNPIDVEQKLPIVEQYHFNANVEALVSGMTSESLGADLDYTLRAFPNHHRALYSMVRYTLRYKSQRVPPGAHFPGECYLLRAVRFKPDDASVRVIYGIFLSKLGRNSDALEQYETAAELAPDSAEVQYNLGLMYRKLNRLDEALEHAKIAYRLGYPLEGLKNQLKEAGVWKDDAQGEAIASSPPHGEG